MSLRILNIAETAEGRLATVETTDAMGHAIVGVVSCAVLYVLTGTDALRAGQVHTL